MKQFKELNNTLLGELKLKYFIVNLFKENNIIDSYFDIEILSNDQLQDCFDFTHNLLEAYSTFKFALKDLDNTLPLTETFESQCLSFEELILQPDIPRNVLTSLGFECFSDGISLDFNDNSSAEKFKSLAIDFDVDYLTSYVDDGYETHYLRYILCHPLLDKLMLSSDYSKISLFENFIGYYSDELAASILNFEICAASNTSVLSIEDILNSPDWNYEHEIKSFKYGIAIDCLDCYDAHSFNYDFIDINYRSILFAIVKLYSLLK